MCLHYFISGVGSTTSSKNSTPRSARTLNSLTPRVGESLQIGGGKDGGLIGTTFTKLRSSADCFKSVRVVSAVSFMVKLAAVSKTKSASTLQVTAATPKVVWRRGSSTSISIMNNREGEGGAAAMVRANFDAAIAAQLSAQKPTPAVTAAATPKVIKHIARSTSLGRDKLSTQPSGAGEGGGGGLTQSSSNTQQQAHTDGVHTHHHHYHHQPQQRAATPPPGDCTAPTRWPPAAPTRTASDTYGHIHDAWRTAAVRTGRYSQKSDF
jgi:hypothetical protein